MPVMTQYENLRENISPNLAQLSDAELESIIARNGGDAEAMEGFFDDLGKFASSAGKAVLKAAPSILPVAGTVVGTAFGGPIGAQIGGSLGSLAGQAVGAATGQRAPASGAGGGGIGGLLSGVAGSLLGGSPAAGQLLQTVSKPETLRALASMAMGSMGASSIPVGGKSVPPNAFTALLKMLTEQAEAEYAETMSRRNGVPEYMLDYAGYPVDDPNVQANRARALYELLESSSEAGAESDSESEAEWEAEAMEAEYDAMELAEIYESEAEYEEA